MIAKAIRATGNPGTPGNMEPMKAKTIQPRPSKRSKMTINGVNLFHKKRVMSNSINLQGMMLSMNLKELEHV